MPVVTQPRPTEDLPQASQPPLRLRYRIRFAKTGLLRWISHRDLARLWERLLRRARLKLSMTEGFHPKPRVAFPSALALGIEGVDEVVEIELAERWSPQELLDHLRKDNQPGLAINSVGLLPERFGKAQLSRSDYTVTVIDGADRSAVEASIGRLRSQTSVTVDRKGKPLSVDPSQQIQALCLQDDLLLLSLAASASASLRPGDVLDLLGLGDWVEQGASITRLRVLLEREFVSDDPDLFALADGADDQATNNEHTRRQEAQPEG